MMTMVSVFVDDLTYLRLVICVWNGYHCGFRVGVYYLQRLMPTTVMMNIVSMLDKLA